MAPPQSSLSRATASVQRLVKEEASYHKELETQQNRLDKLEAEAASGQAEDEEGNREFILKQERQAVEETKRVLPTLKEKITEAVAHLDGLVVEEGHKGMDSDIAQINAAKDAISHAKSAVREIA